jgi:alkanesulfonate monooxygenase SsuD/methylene tetrahydromethanopterin reductase-like flavin-dependent oxidoreductase (luciferase family)
MPAQMPAISLVAVPGRRKQTLEAAREIDRRGYAGIYVPSIFSNMAFCGSLCHATERIPFATSISPIYARTVGEFAQSAAFMHEVSGGRFSLGIGVSHAPAHVRMGVTPGKPLADIRAFVTKYKAVEGLGPLPPVILATLRQQMIRLAGEVGDGMVFANGSRSHMAASLSVLSEAKRNDPKFFIGNMVPTCITDDVEAAKAVHRRTLTHYALLPNYRNYWKEAGYVEEMEAIEAALERKDRDALPGLMTERWLADSTLFGTRKQVLDGLEQWFAAGLKTPILVPSSTSGGQVKAIEELFAAFA